MDILRCLGCGSESDNEICSECVERLLEQTPVDYSVIIGEPRIDYLRAHGSAFVHIGPTYGNEVVFSDPKPIFEMLDSLDVKSLSRDQCEAVLERLGHQIDHLGLPLELEHDTRLYLSMDDITFLSTAIEAVDSIEDRFEGMGPV